MKQPNDKKRPNTNSGKETRERKGNQKYIWVSKRILEVPVFNPDGSLTNIKQMVAERTGHTYVNGRQDGRYSRERERRNNLKNLGWTKKETDAFLRSMG